MSKKFRWHKILNINYILYYTMENYYAIRSIIGYRNIQKLFYLFQAVLNVIINAIIVL